MDIHIMHNLVFTSVLEEMGRIRVRETLVDPWL